MLKFLYYKKMISTCRNVKTREEFFFSQIFYFYFFILILDMYQTQFVA